jgi:hypothetical protein
VLPKSVPADDSTDEVAEDLTALKFILGTLIFALLLVSMGIYISFNKVDVFCGLKRPFAATASGPLGPASAAMDAISIPKPSDWVDYGTILEAAPEGAWDFQWAGITLGNILKKNSTYYFYYVASDGYRSDDGGPRHRAIGVATSQDGIHFTKYHGNPIMTHRPFDGEEEGANSAGIFLDASGDFLMYYGAGKGPESSIEADVRIAVSSDGVNFTDKAMVLDSRNRCVYGYGDELWPVAALQHNGRWYVYYQPNGGTAPRTLGMAWGSNMDDLPNSVKVLDEKTGGKPVNTWGNVVWLAPERMALFIQRLWSPNTFVEVRVASPNTPYQLSEPVERYDIPGLKHGAVFLDTERRTWFMYYNAFDRFWHVKLAPAGDPDITPPTAPTNLSAAAESHDSVKLSWEPATDPDTGVVIYNIYRNGHNIGKTKNWIFTDIGLSALNSYSYSVAAVNFHSTEGPAAQITVSTPADATPPTLLSVTSQADPTQVTVVFSEPIDESSAKNIANYSIGNSITVTDASLDADFRTVTLTTSAHTDNVTYTLTPNKVLDRAATPNPAASDMYAVYTYNSIAGLVGAWTFDEGTGMVATDVSGYGNHGVINGATRQEGLINGALRLDGDNSYVVVNTGPSLRNITNGSFSFTARAKPQEIPSSANGYAILLRVAGHQAYFFGLSYTADRQYRAQLITSPNEAFIALTSAQTDPGAWHHLAMVVDGASKQLHLYLDGKPVKGSPKSYTGTLLDLNQEVGKDYSAGEYYLGSTKPDRGAGSFFSRHFKGMIDDVRIYNGALNAAEVGALSDLGTKPQRFLPALRN